MARTKQTISLHEAQMYGFALRVRTNERFEPERVLACPHCEEAVPATFDDMAAHMITHEDVRLRTAMLLGECVPADPFWLATVMTAHERVQALARVPMDLQPHFALLDAPSVDWRGKPCAMWKCRQCGDSILASRDHAIEHLMIHHVTYERTKILLGDRS